MSSPADLPRPLANALQAVLNRLLRLDPQATGRMAALSGRSIELDLLGTSLRLHIQVDAQGLLQVLGSGEDSDLSLRASPGSLLGLLASGSAGVGQLRIEGDAQLARQIEQLARGWQPDLDELFSRPFGDVLGFQLARAARGLTDWLRGGVSRGATQVAEYLREERKDVVAAAELDGFLDQVDDLRDAVDRAEQRLLRLERNRAATA